MQENTGYEKIYKTKPAKKPVKQAPKRDKAKPWQRDGSKRALWE